MLPPLLAEQHRYLTRRWFFRDCGVGLGAVALNSLLAESGARAAVPAGPHFKPTAKRVIYLFMGGAPSHLELFDYKPQLVKYDGQPCPEEMIKGKRFAFTTGKPLMLGTTHHFAQRGQSGAWVSDVLPGIASVADDLTFIKALYSDQFWLSCGTSSPNRWGRINNINNFSTTGSGNKVMTWSETYGGSTYSGTDDVCCILGDHPYRSPHVIYSIATTYNNGNYTANWSGCYNSIHGWGQNGYLYVR